jgi:thiosulfate/3-mercaptopyruvate sulfurtransferase
MRRTAPRLDGCEPIFREEAYRVKWIVPMNWVLARLYEPDIAIVDVRFQLADREAGRRSYEAGYIPGAVYLDLEKDLSAPTAEHGGRHPLPDPEKLAEKLGKLGISRDTRVVAYDDQGGMMAARLWWLLRYLGHERVYVMDRGFSAWRAAGYPIATAPPAVRVPVRYEARVQPHMLADVHDVRAASETGRACLIDSREPKRYLGLEEPIDPVAGHIPGAVNRFWRDNLTEDGRWRSAEELARRFADLPRDRELIVYCGSGVSACPNVLALDEAGFADVKLYAGSWSDWITYRDNPIATGEE